MKLLETFSFFNHALLKYRFLSYIVHMHDIGVLILKSKLKVACYWLFYLIAIILYLFYEVKLLILLLWACSHSTGSL